ncbi:hypothetical protein V8E53_003251 [Lactarius tabidus]
MPLRHFGPGLRTLRLRLYCTYGTPVLKNLDCWPPLPLVVNYGGFPTLPPPSPEDEDNIMAALELSDRVCSISLTVSTSLLNRLSTISKPFSVLEELVLLSQDVDIPMSKYLSEFLWGNHLRILHSTGLSFPSFPRLPSQDLVDLRLQEITIWKISPEQVANALCGMTQLQSLSFHFLFFTPRPNDFSIPPPSGGRILLPALTYFKYRASSQYLNALVARIDAPCLRDFDITYFSQPTLDASQLGGFIDRVGAWMSPLQADIVLAERAISVTFTEPEDLRIKTVRESDDTDDGHWLRLIRMFGGTKHLSVARQLATDILRALRPADEGHGNLLPALQSLRVFLQGVSTSAPLLDSVQSFLTQRPLSGHPIQLHYVSLPEAEPIPNHTQLHSSRQVLEQASRIPNTFQPSMSTPMFASLTQVSMNGAPSSILAQSAGAVSIQRPTAEEVAYAKRRIEEEKRAFNQSFDGTTGSFQRNVLILFVLGNTEKYIHIAFAALRKEDIVRRMFAMMASTKFQLEESKKPNPRYILELHTIREMLQEGSSMDKGLRTVLGFKLVHRNMRNSHLLWVPFAQLAPPAAPSVTRPPPTRLFQPGHRKKQSQTQAPGAAMSTPTPPPLPTVSTPTPQAATPYIAALSSQTLKSPKGKSAVKPKPQARRKVSAKTNGIETATFVPAVASTPTSSTPVETKRDVNRIREDEADGATRGGASTSSSCRAPLNQELLLDSHHLENDESKQRCWPDSESPFPFTFIDNAAPKIPCDPVNVEQSRQVSIDAQTQWTLGSVSLKFALSDLWVGPLCSRSRPECGGGGGGDGPSQFPSKSTVDLSELALRLDWYKLSGRPWR